MNNEFDYMLKRAARGLMGRREFLGRASAMGISAAMANTLLASAAVRLRHAMLTPVSVPVLLV